MPISQLARLEVAAARRQDEAVDIMLQVMRRLLVGDSLTKLAAPESDQEIDVLATRLAAAIIQIITDAERPFNGDLVLRYAPLRRAAEHLFCISGFANSDPVLRILGASDMQGIRLLRRRDRSAFAKACLLFSLDSELPIDVDIFLEAPAPLALLAVIGLIAHKPILTRVGHERREKLVDLAGRMKPVPLPLNADHLVHLSSAWMLCSYAAVRNKHGFKPVLNQVLRDWGTGHGMADGVFSLPRQLKAKPTLLVLAEIMHSNHVQYRYFGQYLRQLRQRFRLILVTEGSQPDVHVKALFDEILVFRRDHGCAYFKLLIDQIIALAPDVIFWLSIGMRHWGPVLANFRLAPIQIVGLGHCASTFCETIDYFLTEAGFVGDPDLLSEQLVLLPDQSLIFETSPHYTPLQPEIRSVANPLRIALPANLIKLNPNFIDLLCRIREGANRPLEFHSFPNVTGLDKIVLTRLLARRLPGSVVHPVVSYNDYISKLNQCDISLSPFPFGGLNGVVDSLRQGLPLITLEGDDLPARLDSMLIRRLGLPEWWIAQDEGAYLAAALRIINNDAQRVELSRQVIALDVDRVLSGDGTTPLRSEVVDAVWWIYQNHEAIKASGRKVFHSEDWQMLSI